MENAVSAPRTGSEREASHRPASARLHSAGSLARVSQATGHTA
jgi:hypothetical protein